VISKKAFTEIGKKKKGKTKKGERSKDLQPRGGILRSEQTGAGIDRGCKTTDENFGQAFPEYHRRPSDLFIEAVSGKSDSKDSGSWVDAPIKCSSLPGGGCGVLKVAEVSRGKPRNRPTRKRWRLGGKLVTVAASLEVCVGVKLARSGRVGEGNIPRVGGRKRKRMSMSREESRDAHTQPEGPRPKRSVKRREKKFSEGRGESSTSHHKGIL